MKILIVFAALCIAVGAQTQVNSIGLMPYANLGVDFGF
jgi:hypothetical protein